MTKYEKVKRHIHKYGFITKMIAASRYRVYGLAEQIRRMKGRGENIYTVMTPQPNGQDYARYTLLNK